MAFIDDNEVEEVLRIISIETWSMLIPCNRLICCEVHFSAFQCLARNFPTGVSERSECFILGVIHQHIPVCQIQDPRSAIFSCAIPPRVPEFIAYLEGNNGF